MQDFLEKIIQTRKERAMIIATEQGMLERVAQMIDNAISCFQNMGLKVKTGKGTVRWWLTTTDAKVESYSSAEIEVKLGFACSPAEMKGKVRLTKKEAEIAAELQKIWDKSVRYGYFYDCEKFRDLAAKLSVLTHHLRCYKVLTTANAPQISPAVETSTPQPSVAPQQETKAEEIDALPF